MQNIGADNAGDAFYRYKMPKLQAKIEGRGNGIKTNVVNNVDIAKALERPPEYIIKFFGCELGAQTKYDKDSGTSIVNGAHDAKKLSEILEGFIKKYVQCYDCGNPETRVKIKKELIYLHCKACGAKSSVDPRHKLNTFILKNPPEDKLSKEEKRLKVRQEEALGGPAAEKEKESKKDKDKSKSSKSKSKKKKDEEEGKSENGQTEQATEQTAADENGAHGEDDDEKVEWMTDTSAEAMKRRQQEQLTAASALMVQAAEDEAAAAAAASANTSTHSAADSTAANSKAEAVEGDDGDDEGETDGGDEETEVEAITDAASLRAFIKSHNAHDTAKALAESKVAGGTAGRMLLLYEAVLPNGNGKVIDQVTANKKYLLIHSKDHKGQAAQLVAIERYFTHIAPDRVKEVAVLLKSLYELDIIDEEIIIGWFDAPGVAKVLGVSSADAKKVREASKVFVDWLKTAESDEDDDDEDDDDDDE